MDRDELLRDVKARLQQAFGERLRGVILYGSEARGDARPDSDIDIMVLLQGPVDFLDDHHTAFMALYPIVFELDRFLDVKPVDVEEFGQEEFLYSEVKREGVGA